MTRSPDNRVSTQSTNSVKRVQLLNQVRSPLEMPLAAGTVNYQSSDLLDRQTSPQFLRSSTACIYENINVQHSDRANYVSAMKKIDEQT
jgi:hypothetical protein